MKLAQPIYLVEAAFRDVRRAYQRALPADPHDWSVEERAGFDAIDELERLVTLWDSKTLLREVDRLREALESIKANGCGDAAEKCAACMAIDALEVGAISEDQTHE